MNAENITIEDCMDMFIMKGYETIIDNGSVLGFQKEGEMEIIFV